MAIEIDHRVTVLETKLTVMENKLDKHEARTEQLFIKIAETLDDIRDELQSFRIGSLKVDNRVDALSAKGSAIWKTITVVSGIALVSVSTAYQLFKDLS